MLHFLKVHKYIVTLLWVGMVLAISFMEAPLKFQSDLVDTRVGVSIGRIVFTALNRVELVFLILFLLLAIASKSFKTHYKFHVLIAIVLLQTFMLLPYLDERAVKIIQKEPVEDSIGHITYVILEAVKVILLFWISINEIKKQARIHET